MYFLYRQSGVSEPVNSCWSKRGGSHSKGKQYVFFRQEFENGGNCLLLLASFPALQRIAPQCWHCADILPISSFCGLLNQNKCFLSCALWHSCLLRIATAYWVLFSRALLERTRSASLLKSACFWSPSLRTSSNLPTLAPLQVSPVNVKFSLLSGSHTSRAVILFLCFRASRELSLHLLLFWELLPPFSCLYDACELSFVPARHFVHSALLLHVRFALSGFLAASCEEICTLRLEGNISHTNLLEQLLMYQFHYE